RRFVPDAGDAGDVVGRVAPQSLEVDQLGWLEAVALADLVGPVDESVRDARAGHERLDGLRHELQAIEVAGNDGDRVASFLSEPRQGAYQVVRLVTLDGVDRSRDCLEQLPHLFDLRTQVVWHRAPARLVFLVLLRTKC